MQTQASTIFLIHGAWHGAWCWERVIPLLEAKGHRVLAPNLPCNTQSKKISMTDYVELILALLSQQRQPVTLVGHSLAGLIISQVAECMPDKINELIYLAAYVPADGDSLMCLASAASDHYLSPYLQFDESNQEIDLDKASAVEQVFAPMASKADQFHVMSCLHKQPMKPFFDTVSLGDNFKSVTKRAIICEHDKAIAAVDQIRMAEQAGVRLQTLAADHSPFYSCPDALASIIMNRGESKHVESK